jgi:hypothetical protein
MTDAPFTETHRAMLERMTQGPKNLSPLERAIDAALAEIDRLLRRAECDGWRIEDAKAEIDRLTKVAVTPCACGENEGCSECRRVENPPHGPVSERFMRQHYGAKR